MFYYCDTCKDAHDWPDNPSKARGLCGMCSKPAPLLHRVDSKMSLPTPPSGWEREDIKIPQRELDEEDLL